jgi:hypothetical protein
MIDRDTVLNRLEWFHQGKWLRDCELERMTRVLDPQFVFARSLEVADSLHAHVKVHNADDLPEQLFFDEGATIHYRKSGFVKFQFPGGVNFIFSSIPISQDDLRDGTASPENTFLDHIGIDLRNASTDVTELFDALPEEARRRGWGHVSQGDQSKPVYCCHIEVGRKHWIYPEDRYTQQKAKSMPLEFALGELKLNELSAGCDLRPSDPRFHAAVTCCDQKA